jgi:hypothetical protein
MKWVQDRVNEMLPVPYFHVVFTVPSELNPFALRNKEVFYALLFRAVNESLTALAADRKWLGAQIGCISVLHTWGQNLSDHPHIHCLIPAGGIQEKGWKPCKNNFFVPVNVLRTLFRGKFLDYFKVAVKEHEILFHGTLQAFTEKSEFDALLSKLYRTDWVVYIKPSFASPQAVLNYLGRYTHRVAISEKRLRSFANNVVSFSYTDYADNNAKKVMSLPAVEFIRRFLLHALPLHFKRIRHFGIFANRKRTELIAKCRKLLGEMTPVLKDLKPSWWEQILERTGKNPLICTNCSIGLLQLVAIVPPRRYLRY